MNPRLPLYSSLIAAGLVLGAPLALLAASGGSGTTGPGPLLLAQNPCGAKNPCAAANPCAAQNPRAAKSSGEPAKDAKARATAKAYKGWKKVNDEPVKSASHGGTLVFTYINKTAEGSAMTGKFPFHRGATLAKEAWRDAGGKPGGRGDLYIMEKRQKGYDAANGDWHYAVVAPDGSVKMTGSGKAGSSTQFCAGCHMSAKVNDYVFGNGTTMKVKATTVGAAGANPCAAKNPCAARNPCAAKKP